MAIKTPQAILSFPCLFQPEPFEEGSKPTYNCVLVFPPESQQDPLFKGLKEAALAAVVDKFGEDKAAGVIQKQRFPTFRTEDDDEKPRGYPEGSIYINVKSHNKPQIVSLVPDPENNNKAKLITEEMAGEMGSVYEVYSGCLVQATVNAFAYDMKGNRGVSFWLNNLQKQGEGERLAGGLPADQEFEADADAAADLDDLTQEQSEEPEEQEEKPKPAKKGKAKAKDEKSPKKKVDLEGLF